ncbi:MAG: LemA family protein [Bacillati bacterium ANGP1]|uniref:LemA family protein n=1 Tax=Candidatus Segetimicrobium genomatis TaxID=2569760 RepID=A0A537J6S1_9BACT|nr:MAG: LemA family protein [Terrabacteria group bacterium ANGP1]
MAAAVLLAAAAWPALTYNRLVQARAAVDAQWAQVETQYQRRVDLVPNLVEAVRGVLVQERTVFEALPLGRLLGVVESYPNLRSVEAVARLMDELAGTENRIAVERRRYNARVAVYNTRVQQFPTMLVAGLGGFRVRPYFESASAAGTAPALTLSSP